MKEYINLFLKEHTFLKGMASALDIGSTFTPSVLDEVMTSEEKDRYALTLDWQMVGQDLQKAMNQYE